MRIGRRYAKRKKTTSIKKQSFSKEELAFIIASMKLKDDIRC